MGREIPIAVIAVVADIIETRYTRTRIDYFMKAAGVWGEPSLGNKVDETGGPCCSYAGKLRFGSLD